MIFGLLVHIGRNLWSEKAFADHVRCDETVLEEIAEHMADVGANMMVMDLAEALVYPSHPELAVKGSWTAEKMRREIKRLRSLGIEAIPKLNFSSAHDLWLGEWSRMIGTDEYRNVVSDIIRDVAQIFDRPRLIHLGWDEEKYKVMRSYRHVSIRQGELWWQDMLFTAQQARANGMRPWIWSDKEWMDKDEFMERCPRDVVQSHWYYSPFFSEERARRNQAEMEKAQRESWVENHTLCVFQELEQGGFDQICCGSNIYHRNNFHDLVRHCLDVVSPEHLLGFLHAPWAEVKRPNRDDGDGPRGLYLDAVDQLAGAIGMVRRRRPL